MAKVKQLLIGIVLIAGSILLYSSLYTVHQTQQALMLQFGKPLGVVTEPGLHFKAPWRNVIYFDNRILDLDPPVQEAILADQKRVNIDSYARYRIVEPLEFYKKARNEFNFRDIFGKILNSGVRSELGKMVLADLLTSQRAEVMHRITNTLKAQAPNYGIEVVDVRIGRTDLPEDTSQAVYDRMRSSRIATAKQIRAEGEQIKTRITAEANRERTVILAEAERQSQILRGDGIAEQTRILGDAYGRDPQFFQFYRSMQAYSESLGEGTTMVLSPDSEFFRYFDKLPK